CPHAGPGCCAASFGLHSYHGGRERDSGDSVSGSGKAITPLQRIPFMRRSACVLVALLLIGGYDPAWSQEKTPLSPAPGAGSGTPAGRPLTPATRAATIEGVLKRLREGYVFPDVAQKMEEDICERAKKGDYDGITRGEDLARILTAHLREVSQDSHIV